PVSIVTTPTAPFIIGSSDVPFFGHSIAVSGTRAVVGGRTEAGLAHLWVLDLSVPTAPTVLGELATTAPVTTSGTGYMGIALNSTGTRAVMALGSTGIWVVDLTNPAAPSFQGAYNTPGTAYAVALNSAGTLAYVADGSRHRQPRPPRPHRLGDPGAPGHGQGSHAGGRPGLRRRRRGRRPEDL